MKKLKRGNQNENLICTKNALLHIFISTDSPLFIKLSIAMLIPLNFTASLCLSSPVNPKHGLFASQQGQLPGPLQAPLVEGFCTKDLSPTQGTQR